MIGSRATLTGPTSGKDPAVQLPELPPHLWIRLRERDRIQRKLRISLTDHCNLACFFCHNEGQGSIRRDRGAALTLAEIESVARVAASAGVTTLKLTGGEPLLYRSGDDDIVALVRRLADLRSAQPGMDLSVTTNGTLLPQYAKKLRIAGLNRVTLSLTTLDEDTFSSLISRNSGLLTRSVNGLREARNADLTPLKVNVALYYSAQTGIGNLHELRDLFLMARRYDVAEIRLFTLIWHRGFPRFDEFYQFFSGAMCRELRLLFELSDVPDPRETVETLTELACHFANRAYPKIEFGVELGPIRLAFEAMQFGRLPAPAGAQEGPYAMRLSADGALRPTLHGPASYGLINAIRRGDSDSDLQGLYRAEMERMP